MKRTKQYSFFKPAQKEFGGFLLQSKRKGKRPLSVKRPIHLVLKSENATGELSFVNYRHKLEKVITASARQYGIKIYDLAINFNHVHLVISIKRVSAYTAWIRQVTAQIVMLLAKQTKKIVRNFFTYRPYTRILSWGRDLRSALEYLTLNKMEVVGLRPRKEYSKRKRPKNSE